MLSRCRGQCYDGAANMSGRRTGVATQIQLDEPRAIYLHCMGHSLNLAVQDTCRSIKIMSDTFDTILELSKTMKYSSKKKAMLLSLKEELSPHSPSNRPLCPTRWTVRAESLRSIIANYEVVQQLMEDIIEEYSGVIEAKSVARGILATMERFSFLFGVSVSEKVFTITDTLSKAVQKKTLCAVEAQTYATVTLARLKEERNDENFISLWDDLLVKCSQFRVAEPTLPRKRRAPTHLDEASRNTHHDATPRDMYRRLYFEIIDKLVGEIERRFHSPTFSLYSKVETMLMKAAIGENIRVDLLSTVQNHFGDDLHPVELSTELSMLKNTMQGVEFSFQTLEQKICNYRELFPQTSRLLQLLLVMPATSATSERSFSSLRNIKTYLRTTMKQDRLNHLMMIYIHKDRKIDIIKAMREFVQCNDERLRVFGKF